MDCIFGCMQKSSYSGIVTVCRRYDHSQQDPDYVVILAESESETDVSTHEISEVILHSFWFIFLIPWLLLKKLPDRLTHNHR